MKRNNNTAMISGAISSDPDYQQKFAACATVLRGLGFHIMNPATLPKTGFKHWQYMHVTLAMLDVCEILILLPGWNNSPGAIMEFIHAILKRKIIVTYNELINNPDCIGGDPVGFMQAMRILRRQPRPR